MTEKKTIIHLYRVDNFSIRKISRTVNRSRNTVRRIIREYLLALKSPSGSEALEDYLSQKPKPKYRGDGRRPWVMTPEVCGATGNIVDLRYFKQGTGMPPSEYRKGTRINENLQKFF